MERAVLETELRISGMLSKDSVTEIHIPALDISIFKTKNLWEDLTVYWPIMSLLIS